MTRSNAEAVGALAKRIRGRVPVPAAASFAALRALQSRPDRRGIALVYHRVGDTGGDRERELVPALATRLFAAEVELVAQVFALVPACRLPEAVAERRRGERFPAAITFDDDLPSHAHAAAPVLRAAGAPATFFLSGGSLRAPRRFWFEDLQWAGRGHAAGRALAGTVVAAEAAALDRDARAIHGLAARIRDLPPELRADVAARLRAATPAPSPDSVMSAGQVAELAAEGFEIGFHTLRHEALPTLPDADLRLALVEGRDALAELAGGPLESVSYPHGAADARVPEAARTAGWRTGYVAGGGTAAAGGDRLVLPRQGAAQRSLGQFALALALAFMRPPPVPLRPAPTG